MRTPPPSTDDDPATVAWGDHGHKPTTLVGTLLVLNARRNVTPRAGVQIAKAFPDSADKIDAAVAATLAWQARLDALAKGATTKAPGRGRVIVLT